VHVISAATDLIAGQIARFGLWPKLLEPLMEDVRRARIAEIEQYRGGWTSPAPKAWKEWHATWHAIILLAVGGLTGFLLGLVGINDECTTNN
jgi:hypothetical protein